MITGIDINQLSCHPKLGFGLSDRALKHRRHIELLSNAGAEVNSFIRYEVGEGIEKKVEDFAAEVASQLKA